MECIWNEPRLRQLVVFEQQSNHDRNLFEVDSRYFDYLNHILSVSTHLQLHSICILDEIHMQCARIILSIFELDSDIFDFLFNFYTRFWIEFKKNAFWLFLFDSCVNLVQVWGGFNPSPRTKCLPFSRRCFQTLCICVNEKFYILIKISLKFVAMQWHIYAALGGDESMDIGEVLDCFSSFHSTDSTNSPTHGAKEN